MTGAANELHIETPLVEFMGLRSAAGFPALLKMENFQPSGSFKLRGIGRLCTEEAARGARGIVCPSGGNAGFAAAYSGRRLGLPVTIVVPSTTSEEAKRAIRSTGAEVQVEGASFDDAALHARALASDLNAAFVHPFDHPALWHGHATVIDEIVKTGAQFDCIVLSVGGGGLLLGAVEGLERNNLSHIPVIAVETEGADAFRQSIRAGKIVELPAISSIATSLGARRIAEAAFDAAASCPITSLTVTDTQAVSGCLKLADQQRVLVEPACGAAISVFEAHPDVMSEFARPLVIVCGGVGVSLARLNQWRNDFALPAGGETDPATRAIGGTQ